MKKVLIITLNILIIVILSKYFLSNYSITYKIKNYNIKTSYKNNRYYFEIENKIILKYIDNLPDFKSGFFFTKQTVAISVPPQHPLPVSAIPTPVPHIIAPKTTFKIMSSTKGLDRGGNIDSNTVCMATESNVLIQKSLFMIRYAIKNKGTFNKKLIIPNRFSVLDK